jgi:hypothetical protein
MRRFQQIIACSRRAFIPPCKSSLWTARTRLDDRLVF